MEYSAAGIYTGMSLRLCLKMFSAPQDRVHRTKTPATAQAPLSFCTTTVHSALLVILMKIWTVVVKTFVMTWGWWCASGPPWPCQWCSSWYPVATHSPHPTEAPKHQTGNAACLLSCNVPSGPLSSAEWDRSHHVGREKRHQGWWLKAGCLGLDQSRKKGLWSHRAGSVCTGASGRSTPQEHQSLNTFLWDGKTQMLIVGEGRSELGITVDL